MCFFVIDQWASHTKTHNIFHSHPTRQWLFAKHMNTENEHETRSAGVHFWQTHLIIASWIHNDRDTNPGCCVCTNANRRPTQTSSKFIKRKPRTHARAPFVIFLHIAHDWLPIPSGYWKARAPFSGTRRKRWTDERTYISSARALCPQTQSIIHEDDHDGHHDDDDDDEFNFSSKVSLLSLSTWNVDFGSIEWRCAPWFD